MGTLAEPKSTDPDRIVWRLYAAGIGIAIAALVGGIGSALVDSDNPWWQHNRMWVVLCCGCLFAGATIVVVLNHMERAAYAVLIKGLRERLASSIAPEKHAEELRSAGAKHEAVANAATEAAQTARDNARRTEADLKKALDELARRTQERDAAHVVLQRLDADLAKMRTELAQERGQVEAEREQRARELAALRAREQTLQTTVAGIREKVAGAEIHRAAKAITHALHAHWFPNTSQHGQGGLDPSYRVSFWVVRKSRWTCLARTTSKNCTRTWPADEATGLVPGIGPIGVTGLLGGDAGTTFAGLPDGQRNQTDIDAYRDRCHLTEEDWRVATWPWATIRTFPFAKDITANAHWIVVVERQDGGPIESAQAQRRLAEQRATDPHNNGKHANGHHQRARDDPMNIELYLVCTVLARAGVNDEN